MEWDLRALLQMLLKLPWMGIFISLKLEELKPLNKLILLQNKYQVRLVLAL